MARILPPSKPQAKRALVERLALAAWKKEGHVDPLPSFFMLAVDAYYRDTMGKPGQGDRGIYDDAIMIVGPEAYATYNANVDPSVFRRGIAKLKKGVHLFKKGNHGISRPGGGYPAYRPATRNEELPVTRDGIDVPWPGVAINIHKGGYNTTSSEGCQTIYPDQWASFKALGDLQLKLTGQKTFPYILIDGPIT